MLRTCGTGVFYLALEAKPQDKRLLLAANPPKWADRNDLRALVQKSFSLRYSDIGQMIHYSELACALAEALWWKDADHQDARGEAWIQHGSVHRMLGNFKRGQAAFAKARDELAKGSLRPDLQGHLWECCATLYRDWRKHRLAEQALSTALKWNSLAGHLADSHRCLVSRAICAGYGGEPKRAVLLAERAVIGINTRDQPDLAISALIALCWFLVDLGDARTAHACYVHGEALTNGASAALVQAHLSWLRAHIDRALGLHESAEVLYRRAATSFSQQGLSLDCSLALLDLCASLAGQYRHQEAAILAAEIRPEFVRLGLRRESAASRRWLTA